ncbi:MAG: hypothetical protein BGN88_12190 [Clostridiales bacterium 43-6]|nr:MAG: hypothetical protein BGN88_12190 [Clostridiales bacterium 43-6]
MRNVRLFYQKKGNAKYISHLDMNRFMMRAVKRSGVPVWYTEGFNPHPFITFTMPLSLGFETNYDSIEFKIEGEMTNEEIAERFRNVFPATMPVIGVKDCVLKSKELKYASFTITLQAADREAINAYFEKDEIIVSKKTKKGTINQIDIKEKIHNLSLTENGALRLYMVLPAGSEENLNPAVILDAMKLQAVQFTIVGISRNELLDKDFNLFE